MTWEKSRPNGKRTPQSVWGSKRSCNIERNEVETPLVVKQRSGIRFLSGWFIRVIRHSFLTSNNRQVWVEEEWQVLECHKATVTHPPPTVRQQRYLFPDLWTTLLSIACCTAWAVIMHFSERGRNQLCSKILPSVCGLVEENNENLYSPSGGCDSNRSYLFRLQPFEADGRLSNI
jgi:hypothetical protein